MRMEFLIRPPEQVNRALQPHSTLSQRLTGIADAFLMLCLWTKPAFPSDNYVMHRKSVGCGQTRRSFLADTGMGFTGLALSAMLFRDRAQADEIPWRAPDGMAHRTPKAKSVIWIFLCGGVSHVESFDVKPELNKY